MSHTRRSRLPRLDGTLDQRVVLAIALARDGFPEREICAVMGLTAQSLQVACLAAIPPAAVVGRRTMLGTLELVRGVEDAAAIAAAFGAEGLSPESVDVLAQLLDRGRAIRRHERGTPARSVIACRKCGRLHVDTAACPTR